MVTIHLVPADIQAAYEVREWRNAAGVLSTAHPKEWQDILDVLQDFKFARSEVLRGGGRKDGTMKPEDQVVVLARALAQIGDIAAPDDGDGLDGLIRAQAIAERALIEAGLRLDMPPEPPKPALRVVK